MSEYQFYEFLALDRPLDERQQGEVRALSTRATISATRFVNEYHWGNFKGDPAEMMERYYDAHLYLANWGERRLMLRLPRRVLDIDVVEQYCVGEGVMAWTAGDYLVLNLTSEDEPDESFDEVDGTLSTFIGVRDEIAAGDLRPLYLAWLAGYGTWERYEDAFAPEDDKELEPPVPPGLAQLTGSQQALANFLRLDEDLLNVAAEATREDVSHDGELAGWIADLSVAEKDRLLVQVARGHAARVRTELLHRFGDHSTPGPSATRRTVGDLLDSAARMRAER